MRLLKRTVLPALLLLAVYYAVFGGEYSIFELRQARIDVEEARVELAELRERIDSLRARADSLENDPAALERIARERFGMIREGETLYRFAAPGEAAAAGVEAGPTPE
ncbi:MAG: septum formation initiator family protein [Gemmatimonadota bacterium]